MLHGRRLIWLARPDIVSRGRFGFGTLGGTGGRRTYGVEIFALGCGARRPRSEQKIQARRLKGPDRATIFRRHLGLGRRSLDMRGPRLNMRRAVGGQWNLLLVR